MNIAYEREATNVHFEIRVGDKGKSETYLIHGKEVSKSLFLLTHLGVFGVDVETVTTGVALGLALDYVVMTTEDFSEAHHLPEETIKPLLAEMLRFVLSRFEPEEEEGK